MVRNGLRLKLILKLLIFHVQTQIQNPNQKSLETFNYLPKKTH